MKKLLLFFTLILPIAGFVQENIVPGQLLLHFSSDVNVRAEIRKFSEEKQVNIESVDQLSKIVNVYRVRFSDESIDLVKSKELMSEIPGLIHIQLNHTIEFRETIPSDTLFDDQWHLKNTGQTGGTADADIDASDAWDITTGGLTTHEDTIVVCIIENQGVDINHVDLAPNVWHNYAEIPDDGIDNDGNGYIDDFDGWNVDTEDDAVGAGPHGTQVAGMVGAAGNNTTGISGVNWNVKMMIIKGQDVQDEASVIAAYEYPLVMRKMYNESSGQEGAFVVVTNASWGIDGGDTADAPIWCAMYDSLGAYGILNIAATSNQNSNVDVVGDLPTNCSSQYLIGVTMTDDTDDRANSGYGATSVDLGAPGFGVRTTTVSNFYTTKNGTSFASPLVAGAIALAYSSPCSEYINHAKLDPSGAALDMRNFILSSVDLVPDLTGEVVTGGRLNVKNAIDSILSNCNLSFCAPPYNVLDEVLTDTTADIIWGGFSTNYLFYIQEGAGPMIQIPVNGTDSIYFDTLIPCTNYAVWVKGICGTDTSDFSVAYNFKTDGCCDNPELILDSKTADSMLISWNSVLYATEYDFRYRKEGDVTWIATYTDTISPIQLSGLDSCTNYEIQIKTTCTDSTQGFSSSTIYKTLGCGACYEAEYCEISGGTTSSEWIETVVIGSYYSNTGSNGGWYESQDLMGGFIPGQTYNVSLTPGYTSFAFTEHFTLWVDLDQSGTFETNEELISDQTTNSVLNTTITIPVSATHGYTKMRIGMNGEFAPNDCQVLQFWGEYEDYCAYIGADASVSENTLQFTIYPNPAGSILNLESSSQIERIEIYSQDGKLAYTELGPNTAIDISELKSGFYIIKASSAAGSSIQKFIKL